MTLQEAYLAWVETRDLVLHREETNASCFRIRNKAWDVYCAIRDGFTPNHYADRRANFGNPLISDSEVSRITENRRRIVH